MKLKFIAILLFVCSIVVAQNKGKISGVITDKDSNNASLPFANATIKGTKIATTSDEKGKYTLSVTPGNYIIVFSFLGYENIEVPVTIKSGEEIIINKALGSGSYTLQDVVVKSNGGNREKETALLLDQKKAVEIKQSIGAQEMSRKGISDVEEGLTKITGITKVGSRGLFVRGLEDRYNNLLINNLAVPSNNPFKKIIPLDYFYFGKILLRDSTKKAMASEQFEKGIAIDTTQDKAPVLRSIAETYYEAEDYASSAKWYRQLAESSYPTRDERDLWWAGYMSYYSNDLPTAEQMFTKYSQANPSEPLGVLWLAKTNEKAKDKDFKNGSASALYNQWLGMVSESDAAKKKDFTKAYTYLAMLAYNTNNKENVKKYADKLVLFNPEDDTAKQLLKALPAMK